MASLTLHPVHPHGNIPWYPLERSVCVNPRTGLNAVERRKMLPLPRLELGSFGLSAHRKAIYQLHYPSSLFFAWHSVCRKRSTDFLYKNTSSPQRNIESSLWLSKEESCFFLQMHGMPVPHLETSLLILSVIYHSSHEVWTLESL